MKNITALSFQVISNLVYSADLTAVVKKTYEGVSKEGNRPYKFDRYETDITFLGIKIGRLTAAESDAYPKLQEDGQYKLVKAYEWKSTFQKNKEWMSVKEEELKTQGYELFYEGDQESEKGNVNHIRAYGRSVQGAYVQFWCYTNVADKTIPGAIRAQLRLKATTYAEAK